MSFGFDTEETTRFFNQRVSVGIDALTTNHLRDYVEGWPSAMQLIALQAQHQHRTLAQTIESVSHFNHAHLWDYLVEEVFDLLDDETRYFLMQCSVLDHFDDALVSSLTERDDELAMIESLNRFRLFISPLEGKLTGIASTICLMSFSAPTSSAHSAARARFAAPPPKHG